MLWEARNTKHSSNTDEDNRISESGAENESDPSFESLKTIQPQVYQILSMLSRFHRQSFMYTGKENQDDSQDPLENRDDPISISDTSRRIRQAFDDVLCKRPICGANELCHQNCADILHYYGPRPFKCKFPQCEFWHHGFQQRAIRDRHEESHDNPLKCHVSGCQFEAIGFLSERMRNDHINDAHRTSSSDLSFKARNPAQYEVETILLDLVKDNKVESVQHILSTVPGVLDHAAINTLIKLQTTAAFQASGDMLQLLIELPTLRCISLQECFIQSIEGRNMSSFKYLLFTGYDSAHFTPYIQLVSSDWHEGVKQLARWLQATIRKDGRSHKAPYGLFCRETIQAAASHPNGHHQLLYLWEESGISQFVDRRLANDSLKYVRFNRTTKGTPACCEKIICQGR
ncbi:hypothetical protein F4802DRAFT_37640 [Xylaria palmicola]|nr:hypothetical protein F4802DRAFT_37640 [Xylaria palmicola]